LYVYQRVAPMVALSSTQLGDLCGFLSSWPRKIGRKYHWKSHILFTSGWLFMCVCYYVYIHIYIFIHSGVDRLWGLYIYILPRCDIQYSSNISWLGRVWSRTTKNCGIGFGRILDQTLGIYQRNIGHIWPHLWMPILCAKIFGIPKWNGIKSWHL
jgi:hypothetical protein